MDFLVHLIQQSLLFCYSILPSWGLAIILLTTAIRFLLLPFQVIASQQQRRLKRIQPDLERLQSKFKDDLPKLLETRAALMEANGVKSWLMLLVTLLQMPILLAVYNALSGNPAIDGASFAWITNLATYDPYFLLPVSAAVLIWFQMRVPEKAPTALAYVIPVVSFAVTATLPAAIGVYALASSALQLAAQKVIERMV